VKEDKYVGLVLYSVAKADHAKIVSSIYIYHIRVTYNWQLLVCLSRLLWRWQVTSPSLPTDRAPFSSRYQKENYLGSLDKSPHAQAGFIILIW